MGKCITRGQITPIPLTSVVRNTVEDMAQQQGITHVKFTNKKGKEITNADLIEGVEYEENEPQDKKMTMKTNKK